MTPNPQGFVGMIEGFSGARGNRPDAGAMARLRRGLGQGLADLDPAVLPFVQRFLDDDTSPILLALVGNLYAQHPRHNPSGESLALSFASALRSDSQERRFHSLLNANGDELLIRLREVVSLLASADRPLDYVRLYWDLAQWQDDVSRVQLRWARDFWRKRFDPQTLERYEQQASQALAEQKIEGNWLERSKPRYMLILHLQDLSRRDQRAALPDLRAGLGRPNHESRLLPHVAPFLPAEHTADWDGFLLLASLFGLHPSHAEQAPSIASAWRGLMKKAQETESLERRFIALLDADYSELGHQLRQIISLLRADERHFDWRRLLDDLLAWRSPERSVQGRWARDLWG